jgi:hypothetical protein
MRVSMTVRSEARLCARIREPGELHGGQEAAPVRITSLDSSPPPLPALLRPTRSRLQTHVHIHLLALVLIKIVERQLFTSWDKPITLYRHAYCS